LGFRVFTPPANSSSIVSVHLERNADRARDVLNSNGVQVSFREKGSQLRVSPALFNTGDDIRRFLAGPSRLEQPVGTRRLRP
jgi:selenocysteine lyase/cysteine desulfurase